MRLGNNYRLKIFNSLLWRQFDEKNNVCVKFWLDTTLSLLSCWKGDCCYYNSFNENSRSTLCFCCCQDRGWSEIADPRCRGSRCRSWGRFFLKQLRGKYEIYSSIGPEKAFYLKEWINERFLTSHTKKFLRV